jgi:hypothetical protein
VKTFAKRPPAQRNDRRRDRVEYRLHVRLRSADDAQDVARRRLLLEGFREIVVARLELGEQMRTF